MVTATMPYWTTSIFNLAVIPPREQATEYGTAALGALVCDDRVHSPLVSYMGAGTFHVCAMVDTDGGHATARELAHAAAAAAFTAAAGEPAEPDSVLVERANTPPA